MTTYSISLHDVDPALLPLLTHKYNDFLKKEYFEFQVTKTDNIVEDIEATILYTCHICAIDVPAAFAREHTASFKHRANARIASVAAQRTRALITALPPPAAAHPKARFCANCATIVDEKHEKTKEHQAAVLHDKLLWDLMKAYDRDYDELKYEHNFTDNQRNGNNDIHKVKNHKKADIDLKNGDGGDRNNDHLRVAQNIDNIPPKTLKGNREIQNAKNCEVNGDFKKHKNDQECKAETIQYDNRTKIMNNNNTSKNIQSINRPVLVTPSVWGNIPKDTTENESKPIGELDWIGCIVCDCMLDIEDAEDHKYNSKHTHKIINLGNDDYHVREIDESHSHCIVCNLKIKTTEVDMHKQLLLHIVRKDIDENSEGTPASNEKNKEETAVKKETSNIVGSQIEYPYELTATKNLRCVVCKCQVPDGVRSREEHIKGSKHRNAEAKILAMLQ